MKCSIECGRRFPLQLGVMLVFVMLNIEHHVDNVALVVMDIKMLYNVHLHLRIPLRYDSFERKS